MVVVYEEPTGIGEHLTAEEKKTVLALVNMGRKVKRERI